MDYIRQVAPEADLYSIDSSDKYDGKTLESEAIDWLLKNTPDFLGTANHSGFIDEDFMIPYYNRIYDKGCYLVCSAGNEQEEINKLAKGDMWKAIGACRLVYSDGNPVPKIERDYADGDEMDFVSLHKLKATYDNKKHLGTSFSYPIFMGMLGLVQSFFIEKTGKKLTHEQLNRFVKDHCLDLEEEGHDPKVGYGLFILPDPEKIDISRYTDWETVENREEENMPEVFETFSEEQKEFIYKIINQALTIGEHRYKYLRDIPEGEFHDVISYLVDMDIIKGRSGEGEDTEIDLSEDMVRMFVINYRAGLYDF